MATPGSPHLARLDHLLQGLHCLHALVLRGQGKKNGSVPSFLRHKCHQVLCEDMDERLKREGEKTTVTEGNHFLLNGFTQCLSGAQASFPAPLSQGSLYSGRAMRVHRGKAYQTSQMIFPERGRTALTTMRYYDGVKLWHRLALQNQCLCVCLIKC